MVPLEIGQTWRRNKMDEEKTEDLLVKGEKVWESTIEPDPLVYSKVNATLNHNTSIETVVELLNALDVQFHFPLGKYLELSDEVKAALDLKEDSQKLLKDYAESKK